jgi:hypothetical protein
LRTPASPPRSRSFSPQLPPPDPATVETGGTITSESSLTGTLTSEPPPTVEYRFDSDSGTVTDEVESVVERVDGDGANS